MSFPEIMSVVVTVLCAIVCALMFYFRVRGNVFGAVSELVAIAETTGLTGPEKMAQVVVGLAAMVPGFLRKFLTDERLEKIAQWIFDWMRKYADEYKKASEELSETESAEKLGETIGTAAAAELITELLNLTLAALKEKAVEYGVELDGMDTKKEIINAIVVAILTKA